MAPESGETVRYDCEIGPTYYFAPPRVFENLLTQVMIRMEDAGRIKREMFDISWRCATAWRVDFDRKAPVPLSVCCSMRSRD
jgi:long-chain acyl-CoA synthetase